MTIVLDYNEDRTLPLRARGDGGSRELEESLTNKLFRDQEHHEALIYIEAISTYPALHFIE